MPYQFITSEQDADGIVVVTINDPDAKNAVNWSMNQELVVEFERIENDAKARALILTGSGRIFCSGGNIKRMTAQGVSLEPPDPTLREELYPQEADIRRVWHGDALHHPILSPLAAHGLPVEPLLLLLAAQRERQRTTEYETYDELLQYCARATNPLGQFVLAILGYDDEERIAYSDANDILVVFADLLSSGL